MKTAKLFFSLMIIGLLFSTISIFAQEKQHEMSAADKAWMEYMTPGKMHEHFKSQVGSWTYISTFWMEPNSKTPMVTEGTSEITTIFGGRYLKMTYKGEMMGMPFKGFGLTGYDNAKKVYESIWIDNMGTGIMFMSGNYKDGKMILIGTSVDPLTKKDVTVKEVNTDIDQNHFKFEMFMVTDEGEVKTMQIDYTRSK